MARDVHQAQKQVSIVAPVVTTLTSTSVADTRVSCGKQGELVFIRTLYNYMLHHDEDA